MLFINALQIRKPIIQQLVIKVAADLQLCYLKLIYKMKQKSRVGFFWGYFGMINRALIRSNEDVISKLKMSELKNSSDNKSNEGK